MMEKSNPVSDCTVFVVDDDESVRKSLSRLLRSAGHAVEIFASAAELLSREHFNGAGCLVLDVQLPGLNGLELQKTLIEKKDFLPIVFISGHGDISMSVRAMKAGAVDFIPKPFSDKMLLDAVDQALLKCRQERESRAEVARIQARFATLTPRECEVLCHVVNGYLNKQIAADLGTAEKTIKVHRARVMEKMKAESLAGLVRMAEKAAIRPEHFSRS
jgi:FixJ family two-component response regulator